MIIYNSKEQEVQMLPSIQLPNQWKIFHLRFSIRLILIWCFPLVVQILVLTYIDTSISVKYVDLRLFFPFTLYQGKSNLGNNSVSSIHEFFRRNSLFSDHMRLSDRISMLNSTWDHNLICIMLILFLWTLHKYTVFRERYIKPYVEVPLLAANEFNDDYNAGKQYKLWCISLVKRY